MTCHAEEGERVEPRDPVRAARQVDGRLCPSSVRRSPFVTKVTKASPKKSVTIAR